MPHKTPSPKPAKHSGKKTVQIVQKPAAKNLAPLDQLQRDYAAANRKIRERIRTDLDARFDELEDLDYPDVAILTVQGQPVEKVAELLDKRTTEVKTIQKEINHLLAA